MNHDGLSESRNKNLANLPAVPRTSSKPDSNSVSIRRSPEEHLSEWKNETGLNFPFDGLFRKFEDFTREIFGFFEDIMGRMPEMTSFQDAQISQSGENIIVQAKIPGLSTDDLDVNVSEDNVRISGRQQRENEYRGLEGNSYKAEKYYNAFFRTIPLPEKVKYRQAMVEYDNDTLRISIPKINS